LYLSSYVSVYVTLYTHGRAATNMRVFVCATDFTPHRLQRGGGLGRGYLKG